jgi:RimJ/RimL family protein N-acetyltransferase
VEREKTLSRCCGIFYFSIMEPNQNKISVREMQENDIESIIKYWHTSDKEFLTGMGVDLNKIPTREEMEKMLHQQLDQPYEEKGSYCLIWEVDGEAVGHSNVNKIIFGEEAYMHLHLWKNAVRQKGFGTELVKMTVPYFFKNLKLKKLYCEPYALNPAPNKTLEKAGFKFVRTYITTPGWLNFEQQVNLYLTLNPFPSGEGR